MLCLLLLAVLLFYLLFSPSSMQVRNFLKYEEIILEETPARKSAKKIRFNEKRVYVQRLKSRKPPWNQQRSLTSGRVARNFGIIQCDLSRLVFSSTCIGENVTLLPSLVDVMDNSDIGWSRGRDATTSRCSPSLFLPYSFLFPLQRCSSG